MNKKLHILLFVGILGPMGIAEETNLVMFIEEMRACLKRPQVQCLEKHLPEKLYFPEQKDYGCESEDPQNNYLTAKEFAACAKPSQVKKVVCGEFRSNLNKVLKDCFVDKEAEVQKTEPPSIKASGGMYCFTKKKDEGETFILSGISCGN